MSAVWRLRACAISILLSGSPAFAQPKTVAITVDDLPFAGGMLSHRAAPAPADQAKTVNGRLLAAFSARHIPVTGFVIQHGVELLPPESGTRILEEWVSRGFDLGNHTYSHPDINELTVEQFQEDIVRGESTIARLLKEAGKKLEFFRFPMNHTGETKEKHDAIAKFLSEHKYQLAACTIDSSDYVFNDAYVKMLMSHEERSAERLRAEYLAYTSKEIDYYASLNKRVFGYEVSQVMLLHDNWLNADTIDEVLGLFEEKGYQFVSLSAAEADPAYRTPETYITPYGPMWGYRWAKARGVRVNGHLEAEVPRWVTEYKPGSEN
ncbi:MAG TPA: polysaccharide deacetylase family protein [Bryobacteraceae bacterium]|nr:polysaccharide deacetylase family protein [Bryobacteraceae bacterium]